MADGEKGGRDWAVAIVHGIGKTEPRAMLEVVSDALCKARPQLHVANETVVHESAKPVGNGPPVPPSPPQHARYGAIGRSRVSLATAHWSDIAFIGESLVSLIGSLALGGMGVRYFADVGTSGRSVVARLLHGLLMAKIWLLAVGFLPIVLCTLVFSLYAFTGYYLLRYELLRYQAIFIATFSIATISLISWYALSMLWRVRGERSLALPIFRALWAYGVLMGLIFLLDHPRVFGSVLGLNLSTWLTSAMEWWADQSKNPHWRDRIGLIDETGRYIAFLQMLQYLCGFLVICLTAAVLIVLLTAWLLRTGTPEQRRGMRLGAVSVTTMWLLMLLVLWPENLVTSTVLNLYIPDKKDLPATPLLSLDYWSFQVVPVEMKRGLAQLKELMPLIWFDVYFSWLLIWVGVIVGYLHLRRWWWGRHYRNATPNQLDEFRPPFAGKKPHWNHRLLLAGGYQVAAILFMLTISGTAFAHFFRFDKTIANAFPGTPYLNSFANLPHELFMSLANVALLVIVGMILFLGGAHYVRLAVKLALDVVNHFAAPLKNFPVRKRIAQRLHDSIKFLVERSERPHLVVICHSQGTVITLDTLLGFQRFDYEGRWPFRKRQNVWVPGLWEARLKNEVASLTILTFGSPITHLYQHYFSTLYPKLDQYPGIKAVEEDRRAGRIRWFNAYRIDDYIGTYIIPSVEGFPVNVPMPVGGHTDYWKADVFKRLFAEPGMENVLVELAGETVQGGR